MAEILKLILPKGRIQEKVLRLMNRIGLTFNVDPRSYRPACNDREIVAKLLKPQNIPDLVALGRHDCGFTGHDWVVEQKADVVELLDLGFDPVRLVAAVPEALAAPGALAKRRLVVTSEYRNLATDYIRRKGLDAVFLQSFGATEALPPEDADLIVDNTASGETLRQNRLAVVDEIMVSTTRFVANREALRDPWKKRKLDELVMLMRSAVFADEKVLLEMNVPAECFDALVRDLPCMRSPTVAPLHGNQGYAVKIAVPSRDVRELIPRLVAAGARDILEYRLEKIVVG
jgi:ATP phosphoribosyltransferase